MRTRTKIICTIGPAVSSYEKILALIDAGMDVARLNFSHGTHVWFKEMIGYLKKAREERKIPLSIMLDTKGPEIRVGKLQEGEIHFQAQDKIELVGEEILGTNTRISISPAVVLNHLQKGMTLFLDNGYIFAKVVDVQKGKVVIEFQTAGVLKSNKGVNIPDAQISLPAMTDKDVEDIIFGCEQDVDIVAASFIQSADHVLEIKRLLASQGRSDIWVIAKIENNAGIRNFDAILQVADGIMVARGDLGVELPLKKIPGLQKMMIRKSHQVVSPIIIATQMLESMMSNLRPTRAEVSDVANAVYDSADCVTLSGETAAGLYPIQAVGMMRGILEETEKDFDYRGFLEGHLRRNFGDISSSVARSAVQTAYGAEAKAILAFTSRGFTPRFLSQFRPEMPIVVLTPNWKIYHQMAMLWGVVPIEPEAMENIQQAIEHTANACREKGLIQNGDVVIVTAGSPFGVSGTTNMMLVETVGNVLVRGQQGFGRKVHGKVLLLRTPNEHKPEECKDRIVVITECHDKYTDLLKFCLGIVLQNLPDDKTSEKFALQLAKMLDIPIVIRADQALTLLHDGQMVTLEPDRHIVYKRQGF